MIEVIYKEETDTTKETAEYVKLPNNVRQIGEIKGKKKIYMEDYVYTFLKKIARNPHGDEVAAILFGSCHWTGQGDYIFIRSALQIRDLELSPEHIRFDDKVLGEHINGENNSWNNGNITGSDHRARNFTMSAWVKTVSTNGQVMGHGQAPYYLSLIHI